MAGIVNSTLLKILAICDNFVIAYLFVILIQNKNDALKICCFLKSIFFKLTINIKYIITI